MQPRDIQRLEHIAEYCDSIAESVERFGSDFESFRTDKAYNDYRMAKTIVTSIVFAAKRHVWQRMI